MQMHIRKFKLGDLVKPKNSGILNTCVIQAGDKKLTFGEIRNTIGEVIYVNNSHTFYRIWFPATDITLTCSVFALVDANEDYDKAK